MPARACPVLRMPPQNPAAQSAVRKGLPGESANPHLELTGAWAPRPPRDIFFCPAARAVAARPAAAQMQAVRPRARRGSVTHPHGRLPIALIAAMLLGCAKTPGPSVPAVVVPWTPFYWVTASSDSFQFEYAGILLHLQVRQSGPPSLLQLDLAGSGNMPNGFARNAEESLPSPLRRRGEVYGLLGPSVSRHLVGGTDSTRAHWQEGEIGTLGLPNYLTHTLVLDFPNRRMATLPPSIDWASLLGNSAVTASLEKGQRDQVIVPVGAPNGRVFRGLLDTGLSPFPLWTTQAIWQDLTGLGGPGPETRIYRLSNQVARWCSSAPRSGLR